MRALQRASLTDSKFKTEERKREENVREMKEKTWMRTSQADQDVNFIVTKNNISVTQT